MATATDPRGCASCGAALAADQRWCLSCGTRRADAASAQPPWNAARPARVAPVAAAAPSGGFGALLSGTWSGPAVAVVAFVLGISGTALGASGAVRGLAPGAGPPPTQVALPSYGAIEAPIPPGAVPAASADVPPPADVPEAQDTAVADAAPLPVEPVAEVPAEPLPVDDGLDDEVPVDDGLDDQPAGPPPVKHTWIVTLGARPYADRFGERAPLEGKLAELLNQGSLLEGYRPAASGPLADAIALVSGQPPNAATQAGCPALAPIAEVDPITGAAKGDGCLYPKEAQTFFDVALDTRLRVRAIVGDPAAAGAASCTTPTAGSPAAREPLALFASVREAEGCAERFATVEALKADLAERDGPAAFTYVSPPACTGDAAAVRACEDAHLDAVVTPILASKAYEEGGLVIITGLGAAPPAAGARQAPATSTTATTTTPTATTPTNTTPSGPASAEELEATGALLLSPFVATGGAVKAKVGPLDLLKTLGDALRTAPLGTTVDAKGLDSKTVFPNVPESSGEAGGVTTG